MNFHTGMICVVSLMVLSTVATAGENNRLIVLQESPNGGVSGNALTVDQSAASNSLLIGPSVSMTSNLAGGTLAVGDLRPAVDSPDRPAVQRGDGNSATVVITGDGGQLQLLQDNSQAGTDIGNRASAHLAAGALGGILQAGDNNQASLDVGELGTGLIAQNGNDNQASLIVNSGGTGQIIQNGNRNVQPLTVNSNTTVTVTQEGNGLQPVGPTGIQVFSTNPGVISIIQSAFR
jgi:hypothetical protein